MKKEKKSSIFWILIIFFVLFSIWQLWVPEALDDWRWGSEVGIMRLKTWFEGYNGRYFGDILVIVFNKIADRIEKYGYFWDNDRNVILDISIDRI